MKKTICDSCGKENVGSFKYKRNGSSWIYIDLCVNCVQDFVLKNQIKLHESTDSISDKKRIING